MVSDSLDGGEDVEHNGVAFVEITEIFAMREPFIFVTQPFDRVLL